MADRHASFAQLSGEESEGIDYRICVTERESGTAIIVSTHGMAGEQDAVLLGGLDHRLRDAVWGALDAAKFPSEIAQSGRHAAVSRNNVCNRGQRGRGVRLELSMALRENLPASGDAMNTFAGGIREAIALH